MRRQSLLWRLTAAAAGRHWLWRCRPQTDEVHLRDRVAILGHALEELTPRQALLIGVVTAQLLSLLALSLLLLLFSF